LSGDFNDEVDREDDFKLTTGAESLHEISNDNQLVVVNSAISKNFTVKSTTFPHRNIHKYTWTSPGGRIQPDLPHSDIQTKTFKCTYVESFRRAECDSD
jgi:hypothetical protein